MKSSERAAANFDKELTASGDDNSITDIGPGETDKSKSTGESISYIG